MHGILIMRSASISHQISIISRFAKRRLKRGGEEGKREGEKEMKIEGKAKDEWRREQGRG
jgi:hypothetical protein